MHSDRVEKFFSPFFNDRKSSIKSKRRRGGYNSDNTKLASTTLVQWGSGIICNRTCASTSVKQHLNKVLRSGTPYGRKPNPKTSGLEIVGQGLVPEGISARDAELIAGARSLSISFNYESASLKWVSWSGEQNINPHSCHLKSSNGVNGL